jgi:KDO2-lipid IV(A) lauroyltransferase
MGTLCYRTMPRYRNVARRNLTRALGADRSPAEIEELVRRCFRHHGQTLVEFLKMASWDGETIEQKVQVRAREHLDGALSLGRGAILVSAHYGNWELAAARIARLGYPVHVIARDVDDSGVGALFEQIRSRAGYRVISRRRGLRDALACLRRNEVVVILMDQNTMQGEVFVDFFGRPAATTTAPAILARRTGAPLVPGFIRRLRDGTHIAQGLPVVEAPATDDPKHDVWEITRRLTRVIEEWIRVEPEQWLWIHDRWKHQPEAPSIPDPLVSSPLPQAPAE